MNEETASTWKNERPSLEDIREAFNPFALHSGPRMLMYMYVDEEYYERKRNEFALSRIVDHRGTYKSLYEAYEESEQAEQDIKPLEAFSCWVCGHTGGNMVMISINHFMCTNCHDIFAKLFHRVHNY